MLFVYEVISKEGDKVKGRLEAQNRTSAISGLQSKGYTIIQLTEDRGGFLNIKLLQRVRTRDLVVFAKQISILFEAEISALRAFNLVSSYARNETLRNILVDIARSIEKGSSIENAFRKHNNVFDDFFISIIAVGEQSGTLSRSFSYLSEYVERAYELQTKVKRALTYPIFVIIVFFVVMYLMFVTVIPQISGILLESGQQLPLVTNIVLSISDILKDNTVVILGVISALVISLIWYRGTEEGRYLFDSWKVNAPVFGNLSKTFYLVRFADNLSVMLRSGVPISRSLDTMADVVDNLVFKEEIEDISRKVRQGVNLSSAVSSSTLFGKDVGHIIRVGEESGELSKMLESLSKFYQNQLQEVISTIIDLIQPTVIVFLGLAVGLLIGSVILPIYSLSTAI